MSTYVARPIRTGDRPGPWPGVVVIHDILGVGDDVREQADWLAAAGYLAVVPDLFQSRTPIRCLKAVFGQLAEQRGPVFELIEDARLALAADEDCTGVVGVIGFCMGGAFALLQAANPGYSAASVNYGLVPDNAAEILAGACPVLAAYGGRDRSLASAPAKLRAAADRAGAHLDLTVYPDAGHAFINRFAVASPLVPMLKVAGVRYDHSSAAEAKRKILAFFDAYLRGKPTSDDVEHGETD